MASIQSWGKNVLPIKEQAFLIEISGGSIISQPVVINEIGVKKKDGTSIQFNLHPVAYDSVRKGLPCQWENRVSMMDNDAMFDANSPFFFVDPVNETMDSYVEFDSFGRFIVTCPLDVEIENIDIWVGGDGSSYTGENTPSTVFVYQIMNTNYESYLGQGRSTAGLNLLGTFKNHIKAENALCQSLKVGKYIEKVWKFDSITKETPGVI